MVNVEYKAIWSFRMIIWVFFSIWILKTESAKWDARFSVYTIGYGKAAIMRCTFTDKFEGFYRSNREPIILNSRVKVLDGDAYTKILEIDNLQESDYGNYTCTDSTGSNTALLEIDVTIPSILSPQKFVSGSNGFIKAPVYGKPRYKITWTYIYPSGDKSILATLDNDVAVADNGKYSVSTDGLTINNIQKADSGEYEVSSLTIGSRVSQKVLVDVGEKPTLKSKGPTLLNSTEGLDLFIPCLWNEPVSNETWKFESISPKFISAVSPKLYNASGLFLSNLSTSNEGNYTCLASNSYGESSFTVFLSKVLSIPIIRADSFNNVETLPLKSFVISCASYGSPPPDIAIIKLQPSATILKSGIGIVNYTTPLDEANSGDYLCEAQNGAKSSDGSVVVAKKKMTVDILSPPYIVKNLSTTIAVSAVGLDLKFDCVATGNPIPSITFEHTAFHQIPIITRANTTNISSISMVIKNVTKEDFLLVNCKAKNNIGFAEHEIQSKEVLKPPTPEGLKISGLAGLEYIDLQWKSVVTADKYIIYVNDTLQILESYSNYVTVNNLNRNTYYNFKVAAQNIAGLGFTSESIVLKTSSIMKPGIPTNITSDQSSSSSVVKWKPPQNVLREKSIISYSVTVCKFNNLTDFESDCIQLDETRETQMMLNKLNKATTYKVSITALNQGLKGETAVFIFQTKDAEPNVNSALGRMSLDSGSIAGIIIAVMMTILVVVDIFCCFFNNCGFTHCCYEAFCSSKSTKYIPSDGKRNEEKELKPAKEKLLENAV
ncbi:hemicentin-1 isoform X1 [Hydra vulgaris]|uniref:hemicentin-1 isoform X1 n=1 Tax=Hydra vulgaris TaxID=6087 RepID=UPI000640E763|nr:hemicentin-1 isoform X1 [Hydra vulgaris]